MELGLKNKVAIVTGSSKGIGLQTALQLVQEGVNVTICARQQEQLQTAKQLIKEQTGKDVLALQIDVSKEEQCQLLIEETVKTYGQLDILVNNAGAMAAGHFASLSNETWQNDLDLKLFGAINCSKFALPYLKQSSNGSIVNLTAIGGKHPGANSMPSSISRAAGLALTKAMSKDLGADGVRVNAVCIGLIRSAQIEKQWQENASHLTWEQYSQEQGKVIPLGRIGEVHEAANTIVFLCSQAASYISGVALNIDGGSSSSY